ncbi:MAG: hypothetical protein H7Y17_17535 [Chlorobia bacterium]|nr:hypothetical protein [Fimbriimonadaceae bacterium]
MNLGERYLRLGDMLLHRGELNSRKLKRGLKVAHETRRRLGDVLIDLGYASEEVVTRCLAEQYGFVYEDLSQVQPDPAALKRLTPEFALKWCILPLEDGERFKCVIADPLNVELSDTIAAIARKPVSLTLAGKPSLQHAVRVAYGLPIPKVAKGRRRLPQPEAIMQRDRVLLLEAINFELGIDQSLRRAS